jgi:hypothetical protein
VAAPRHDVTHTARTSHTLSTTDTVSAHGIDIVRSAAAAPVALGQEESWGLEEEEGDS